MLNRKDIHNEAILKPDITRQHFRNKSKMLPNKHRTTLKTKDKNNGIHRLNSGK